MTKKLKHIFSDDQDVLNSIQERESGDIVLAINDVDSKVGILKEDVENKLGELKCEIDAIELMVPENGKDGEKGERGEDGYTPIKDVDYFDGRDGLDGETPTKEELISIIKPLIPNPIPGEKGKDGKSPTIESIIEEIKKGKHIEVRDIKGMPINMNDQRWHGGGLSNITGLIQAGSNITITGSGTKTDPYIINATSSSTLSLETNGTTNGSQALLNLKQGTNMTITDDGVGGITFDSTSVATPPGGSNTQVQFNDSGAFYGDSGFAYNKSTKEVTLTKTSLGSTTTDSINARNTTSATSGNQQVSPAITRIGQGWKTDGGGASQSVSFRDYVLPVQGSANPTGIIKNQFSINGGTWTDAFWYDTTPGGVGFSIYTSTGQSNGTPGTTRLVSLNNTGQNTWVDFNFSGTRKSSFGADSQGQVIVDASSNNGLVVRVSNTAYHYLGNGVLLTYGYGGFQSGINAGSTNINTSTLQSSGGTALKVARLIVDTTLDNSYTKIIADATGNSSCTGTPTYDCNHWTNQTDCELRNAHGGPCVWNAGNPCSAFDNEFGMGNCLANSPCSASTNSCVGPTDESTCIAQDDTYGGDCIFNAETTGDCSAFSDGGGDGAICMSTPGCSYDSGTGVCSGTYVITPADCSGTYYTGSCTGTYGESCSGTASCAGIIGSSNCGGEAGCSYVTRIQLYLPDLTTCPDRDYWIINGASGGEDAIIYPYSGQTVNMASSYTISNYNDGIHISPYNDTRSCASLAETPCGTTTGCTQNYSNCAWDAGGNVCNGGTGCSGYSDEGSCNAATYFSSCSGTYVVSKNWYVWSRT